MGPWEWLLAALIYIPFILAALFGNEEPCPGCAALDIDDPR